MKELREAGQPIGDLRIAQRLRLLLPFCLTVSVHRNALRELRALLMTPVYRLGTSRPDSIRESEYQRNRAK